MYDDKSEEHLLPNSAQDTSYEDADDETPYPEHSPHLAARHPSYNRPALIAYSFLVVSLLGNLFLLHSYYTLSHTPDTCRSKFSGLGYDDPVEYRINSDYRSANATVADPLWEAIDVSPIIVALSDSYALEHGLALSARFPWDESKGIYHVKVFHHLHCLKNLRKAYTDLQRGSNTPQLIAPEHVFHCLDTLRQDMMCLADDTPMPTVNELHRIGNGQVRQCRDLTKLIAWTQEPERHACYRMLSDYRRVPHSLEQFAFCDEHSEYFPVMKKYFDENGHMNPYGD